MLNLKKGELLNILIGGLLSAGLTIGSELISTSYINNEIEEKIDSRLSEMQEKTPNESQET